MTTAYRNPLFRQQDANLTQLKSRPDTSLYKQIHLTIRNRILSGEYPDQSLLPGEMKLSRQFGVSRITAKRALNELAAEGLCSRKRGSGSLVTFNPSNGPLQANAQGLLDFISYVGQKAGGVLLELEYLPASSEIAEIMKIPAGIDIQRTVKVRYFDDKPFSYLTTCVPAGIGRLINPDDLGNTAVLTLLERQGLKIAQAEQTITSTLADTTVAEALNIKPGSPLLRITRIVFDSSMSVVEYIVGLYRPDRFEYRMMLSRVSDGGVKSWASLG
ncbi:MAG: GntR family transcriptional regulator [Planctomycetota bacterium]|jgi:GntR family transcriptional regulator